MNQTFSFARFARLHRWLWATKRRTYLIGAGVLVLLSVLYLVQVLRTDGVFSQKIQTDNLPIFVIIALLLTGGLGSDVFSALYRQESAITYLMLPASRSEKFWLGVLYYIVPLLLYAFVYFGSEATLFSLANDRLRPDQTDRYVSSLVYHTDESQDGIGVSLAILWLFFCALAVSFIGSFFLRRSVFIKNIGIALGAFFGLLLLYWLILGSQFPGMDVSGFPPFLSATVFDKDRQAYQLLLPSWLPTLIYPVMLLMLWIIARVRFNEIER